jgi:hypothetical protein
MNIPARYFVASTIGRGTSCNPSPLANHQESPPPPFTQKIRTLSCLALQETIESEPPQIASLGGQRVLLYMHAKVHWVNGTQFNHLINDCHWNCVMVLETNSFWRGRPTLLRVSPIRNFTLVVSHPLWKMTNSIGPTPHTAVRYHIAPIVWLATWFTPHWPSLQQTSIVWHYAKSQVNKDY